MPESNDELEKRAYIKFLITLMWKMKISGLKKMLDLALMETDK